MRPNFIRNNKKLVVLTSIAIAILFALSVLALTTGNTRANPEDEEIPVSLKCESGISDTYTIEAGNSRSRSIGNLFEAFSSDASKAGVTFATSGVNNLRITGLKAGVASIAYGTRDGVISVARYQITDSKNISAYIIKDGGKIQLDSPGDSKTIPVEVTGGTDNIKWKSLNQAIASVDANTGIVKANKKGVTIIIGEFTDKWGVERDIHILAGVQVSLDGIDAPGGGNDNLIGPDNGGNYYKPVNNPPNIFEVVDENGKSKQPPEFVYDPDGNPADGNGKPAYPDGGNYYVEDPEGSNIWKPVDPNGGLNGDNAVWGGGNGRPGGGDDKPVTSFGNSWWADMGQNVWRYVDKNDPTGPLGPLTGGGPDKNPAATGNKGRPIYTDGNGIFFIEAGKDADGYDIYYGDPWTPGSDKLLNSTADGTEGDDVIYYKDANGNMSTKKPPKPITEPDGGNAVDGRILDKSIAGDTADWIEIARNGDYSLIMRSKYIVLTGGWADIPENQYTVFSSTDNKYVGSTVQTKINEWFDPLSSAPQKLAENANLRNYTVKNNALYAIGSGSVLSGAGYNDGFSKPIATPDSTGANVAFALSYGEIANYISSSYTWGGGSSAKSSAVAKANFAKLQPYISGFPSNRFMWLRSPGVKSEQVCELSLAGATCGYAFHEMITGSGLIYPALWVHSDIFN